MTGGSFELHFALFKSERAQKFRAGSFHETQIVGVIDNAARIGVFPINADWIGKDFFSHAIKASALDSVRTLKIVHNKGFEPQ